MATSSSSTTRKKWRLTAPPPDGFNIHLGGITPVLAHGPLVNRLLFNRSIKTQAQAKKYLNPSIEGLTDPFTLPDMELAATRIVRAIRDSEPIGVFGDFDVDGLSGTAVMVRAIEDLGGSALPYIPHRESDGHGLSMQAVSAFADSGVKLIVTVDTGSTAIDEVATAKSSGIDTIITDHHLLDEDRPDAVALVNPQAGSADLTPLAGAGVAFKLAQAMYGISDRDCPYDLMALAALGTIADSAPLIDENRLITRFGLEELGRTRHPGLQALLDISRRGSSGRPDTEMISFYVSPRLNAPGRLGDAEPSLRILTTNSHDEAKILAARLDSANTERRKLSDEAWKEAQRQMDEKVGASPIIAIRCDDFPAGILGPLAGKLSDVYQKPAAAYSVTDGVARASMRSVPGFDLHAALTPVGETLIRFGGHAAAAGFTVEIGYLDAVLAELERQATWSMMGVDTEPTLEIDAEVSLSAMGASMWDLIGIMEPFGMANRKPVFLSRGVQPAEVRTIGSGGRHLRMTLEHEGRRVGAIGFGLGDVPLGSGLVDIVYELRSDTWNGRVRKELGLIDIRPSRS